MKSNTIDIGIKNTSVFEKIFAERILKHLLNKPSHLMSTRQPIKKPQKMTQKRFQAKNGVMRTTSISKILQVLTLKDTIYLTEYCIFRSVAPT